MRITLLRNTVADGRTVGVGQTVDVSDAAGKTLVQMGKAVEAAPAPADRAPITLVAVDPVIEPAPDQPAAPIEAAAPPPPARRGKAKGGH